MRTADINPYRACCPQHNTRSRVRTLLRTGRGHVRKYVRNGVRAIRLVSHSCTCGESLMSLHEDADGLEVPTGSSEGTGRPPSARGRAPRPAGAHRDLRSARLGIKRALRDLRAGRISGRRFEALVAAHRNLAKIAMRQLRE